MDEAMEASGLVGSRLRAAREAQGRTVEEIGRQTRVPVRHLEQIEQSKLEGLPAAPYSAGFVKAYARVVGLDPVALSQSFRAEFDRARRGSARVPYQPYEPADPIRLPPRLLAIVALVIAVLLVGGYAIWRSGVLTGEGPNARARLAAGVDGLPAPARRPVPSQAGIVPPALATKPPVELTARDDVWVSITERSGARIFLGVIAKGKSYTVPATAADPVIRLGKAEALLVTVGGKAVAPLGPPATTLANVSLKAPALLARGSAVASGVGTAPVPTIDRVPTPADQNIPAAFKGTGGR